MTDKYIDLKAIMESPMRQFIRIHTGETRPEDWVISGADIMKIPISDVRPVARGEWIECDWCVPAHGFVEHYKNAAWKCSKCKHAFKKKELLVRNFCNNCGADMRPRKETK